MKPHLFKVLDQWLAFFRGNCAPTGFSAADTPHEAYRMLINGEFSVEYQSPVVAEMQTAEVFHFSVGDGPRRRPRSRHRIVKSTCRTPVGRVASQETFRSLPRTGARK
jgi:hypothetical protein